MPSNGDFGPPPFLSAVDVLGHWGSTFSKRMSTDTVFICKNCKIHHKINGSMFALLFQGLSGFEELRKYIKHGNEFCREVSAIMQER